MGGGPRYLTAWAERREKWVPRWGGLHRTMGWTLAASSRLNVAGERQNRPLARSRPPDDEHHLAQGRSRGQTESLAWVPARTCGRANVSPAARSGVLVRTGSCELDTRRYPPSPSQSLASIQAGTIGTENNTPPHCTPGLHKKKKSGSTNEHQRSSRACSHTHKKRYSSGAADSTCASSAVDRATTHTNPNGYTEPNGQHTWLVWLRDPVRPHPSSWVA